MNDQWQNRLRYSKLAEVPMSWLDFIPVNEAALGLLYSGGEIPSVYLRNTF